MPHQLCLLYHRVNNYNDKLFGAVSVKHFSEHMEVLSRKYFVKRFNEDTNNNEKEPSVVITFDDGYRDNYLNAFPIVEKYKIPITIFVSTGNIGTQKEFWWEEIERHLLCGDNHDNFRLIDPLYDYCWETDTIEKREELVLTLRHLLRLEPSLARRDEWMRQLRIWSGLAENGRNENLSVTPEELKELSVSDYVTIGGHTITHRSLGCLTDSEQRIEIAGSILWLEECIGKEIDCFSYPFGSRLDYNQTTIDILIENGIKRAAVLESHYNCYEDQYRVPRIAVTDVSGDVFERLINEVIARR